MKMSFSNGNNYKCRIKMSNSFTTDQINHTIKVKKSY